MNYCHVLQLVGEYNTIDQIYYDGCESKTYNLAFSQNHFAQFNSARQFPKHLES